MSFGSIFFIEYNLFFSFHYQLDEDGDELKGVGSKWHVLPHESDLVSLYRQIPFEAILSHVFSLKINKGSIVLDICLS